MKLSGVTWWTRNEAFTSTKEMVGIGEKYKDADVNVVMNGTAPKASEEDFQKSKCSYLSWSLFQCLLI